MRADRLRMRVLPMLVVLALASGSACGTDGTGGGPGSGGAASTRTGGSGIGNGGASSTGGATVGRGGAGAAGSGVSVGSGGSGGAGGNANVSTGGAGVGAGGVGVNGGNGGSAGGVAGGGGTVWRCPASAPGAYAGTPIPPGETPTRIVGAPPANDAFNMYNFGNVEGPVWIHDALYFSDMKNGDLPASRILKITESDAVTVFIENAGSNGLAVDPGGNLVSANHGKQGIVRFPWPDKTAAATVVSTYNSKPFNCPNDLAIRSDGTIYFTDPTHQNNANPPQGGPLQGTRVYQVSAGSTPAAAIVATDYTNQPNGISLSLDEQTLIVGGGSGVKKYAITGSGPGTVAATGVAFGPSDISNVNTDGMVLDCAGNLYVAVANSTNVIVVAPDGTKLGTIAVPGGPSAVTNVAFGGSDHRTLYITGQGNDTQRGVFKIRLNFPGQPY